MNPVQKLSWAERRREELRWQLQRRIARRNSFIVWPVLILAGVVGILLAGLIGYILRTGGLGFPMGILLFAGLLWLHECLTDWLPTNPNYVKLKR